MLEIATFYQMQDTGAYEEFRSVCGDVGLLFGAGRQWSGWLHPDVAVPIITAALTVGAVAVTINQLQQVRSAELDIKRKEIELEGMKNGQVDRETISISDSDLKKIQETGKLKVKLDDGSEKDMSVCIMRRLE